MPEQSERDAIYNGRRPGHEALARAIGAEASHKLSALEVELPRLLDGVDTVYLPLGGGASCEAAVRAAIEVLRAHERAGEVAPECLRDARGLLGEERMLKDADQITSLANGNIQSFEVLNESQFPNGSWGVTLKTMVSIGKLKKFVQAKGISIEIKGGLFAVNIKQQLLNEQSEIKAVCEMVVLLHETMQIAFDYEM